MNERSFIMIFAFIIFVKNFVRTLSEDYRIVLYINMRITAYNLQSCRDSGSKKKN